MNNKMKRTPKLSPIRGLSLIEVLVTITITSIGLMGLVSLQMQAVRATSDSGNRSQAVWVFNDIINRIHANEGASTNYITGGVYACAAPATICSSYHNGIAPVDSAANCTAAQVAAWDLFEVACGSPKPLGTGNSIDYLPEAELTVACLGAACDDGDPLTITLQWRARTNDEAVTGAARDANSGLLTLTDVITP